jgi:hypothetical protein
MDLPLYSLVVARDPLPPLLFVVFIEASSRMMSAIMDRGFLSGF